MRILALLICMVFATPAAAQPTVDDLAFLEGHWRGGDENFTFEELWSTPEGGVMTAMARGVANGELSVLEYIVVSEEPAGLVMRFKHFNADYSVWEGEEEPLTLTLSKIDSAGAIFASDPPTHTVKSIRYKMLDDETLRVDVAQIENGEEGGFSLVFKRID